MRRSLPVITSRTTITAVSRARPPNNAAFLTRAAEASASPASVTGSTALRTAAERWSPIVTALPPPEGAGEFRHSPSSAPGIRRAAHEAYGLMGRAKSPGAGRTEGLRSGSPGPKVPFLPPGLPDPGTATAGAGTAGGDSTSAQRLRPRVARAAGSVGHRQVRRYDDGEKRCPAPEPEAQRFVEPDGAGVGCRRVQERRLAALPDLVGDGEDEPGGEPLATHGLVRADAADLAPPRRVEPFALPWRRGPAAADTQVGAELDGARQERPGAGPCHQVEHLRHIGRTEADGLRIRGCCHPVVDELDALRAEGDLPIAGRRLTQRGEGDGPSGAG